MKCLSILALVTISTCELQAQKPNQPKRTVAPSNDTDTSSQFINIRYADELNYLATGQDTLQKLIGHVELNQDTIFLFCDSATIFNSVQMVAKGNFIMQQGDSMTIFADSAEYSSRTKIADLYSDVSMVKGRQKLFTDRLTYNADTKIATYLTGATMTDDTTYLRSVRGYFHAKTDDIFFKDSVVVVNPDFVLRSDTLKFNARTKIVTFLAPTLLVQDTAKIYTESGTYDINKKYAEFNTNPQYVKNDQKAWAERMTYDGQTEWITLIGDAHFEDSVSVATADVIRHNQKTQVTILEGDAFFKDKDRTLTGDTITYDAKNETYSTRGRSHIVDGEQVLDADQVDYIKEKEMGIASGNVIFTDTLKKMTVICEYAEHSKKRNFLKAFGGRDTLGRQSSRPLMIKEVDGDSLFISADTLISFVPAKKDSVQSISSNSPKEESGGQRSAEAVEMVDSTLTGTDPTIIQIKESPIDTIPENVLAELKSNKDTVAEIIEIPATEVPPPSPTNGVEYPLPDLFDEQKTSENIDTPLLDLLDETVPEENTRIGPAPKKQEEERIILAFNDVRIYKSDLQALCDSMSYSSLDSMFRLYQAPIIWSDTSQFTADHIRIQMANDSIDRIFMEGNTFIVNTPDEVFFNQIKGRNATAYFDSSQLKHVRVVGNAESVYYALDEEAAYIGVNKTVCSEMKILFGNNEVKGIVFYSQPKANLYPMREADHAGLQMEGFSWQVGRRPNSVEDLLKVKKQSAGTPTRPKPKGELPLEKKSAPAVEPKKK